MNEILFVFASMLSDLNAFLSPHKVLKVPQRGVNNRKSFFASRPLVRTNKVNWLYPVRMGLYRDGCVYTKLENDNNILLQLTLSSYYYIR